MTGRTLIRLIPVGVALTVGFLIAMWPPLRFAYLDGNEFASHFGVLALFSLLIERTVEIFMSIWRSEEANNREAALQRLIADKTPATDPSFVEAQKSLINYKAETMQWTIPIGFTLGLLISAFGVRALSQFVDFTTPAARILSDRQRFWFNLSDILFTGALLAGGADPIHKALDLYRKFVESSAAKAAGTKP